MEQSAIVTRENQEPAVQDPTQTLPEESPKVEERLEEGSDKGGENNPDDASDSSNNEAAEESSSNGDEDEQDENEEPLYLGGEADVPAFAVLTGVDEDDPSDAISIPLTRLPATLGRSHDTTDRHFFSVGERKSLSRQHCVIYYQNQIGGRLGQFDNDSEEFTYRPPTSKQEGPAAKGPKTGFFAVECVGRNRIIVDGKRVEKGEVALLKHGSAIKMSALSLYFLLPVPTNNSDINTIEVPTAQQRKRKAPAADGAKPPKQRRAATATTAGVAAELEALPLDTLLSRMTQAIESNQWDRKHQMIGSAISMHAVKDAAQAKEIRELAKKDANNAVARNDIMTWIQKNATYHEWVSQMLSKMELKSYQSNVSKALSKAGYIRTGTTGRHVKWTLPKTNADSVDESSKKEEEVEEDNYEQDKEEEDKEDKEKEKKEVNHEESRFNEPPDVQDGDHNNRNESDGGDGQHPMDAQQK